VDFGLQIAPPGIEIAALELEAPWQAEQLEVVAL